MLSLDAIFDIVHQCCPLIFLFIPAHSCQRPLVFPFMPASFVHWCCSCDIVHWCCPLVLPFGVRRQSCNSKKPQNCVLAERFCCALYLLFGHCDTYEYSTGPRYHFWSALLLFNITSCAATKEVCKEQKWTQETQRGFTNSNRGSTGVYK